MRIAALVIFCAFLLWWPSVAQQQQTKPRAAKNKSSAEKQVAPPTHVVIDPPFPAVPYPQNQSANTQTQVPEKPLPRFLRPEWVIIYITAVYVSFTGLILLAMRRQANTMDQQAKDARRSASDAAETAQATLNAIERQVINLRRQVTWLRFSAKAAKLTAQAAVTTAKATQRSIEALINSERAWAMVDIEWQVGPRIFVSESLVDGQHIEHTGIFVNFICRNEGKSFAQIIEKGYVLKIVNVLPQEPDFSDIDIFHYASEYIAAGAASEPYKLSGIQCQGRQKHDNMMVIYGRVKYRDIYGEHETRFGYIITGMGNLDRLPTSSYPEYNEHT